MNGEFTYDGKDPLLEELREAACEAIMLNPGIGLEQWREVMMANYPLEVVDALGVDRDEARAGLAVLWESLHADSQTLKGRVNNPSNQLNDNKNSQRPRLQLRIREGEIHNQ